MNVGLTTTASGAHSFCAFCATIKVPETKQPNLFTTHVILDEEDESFQPEDPIDPPIMDTEEIEDPEVKLNEPMTQSNYKPLWSTLVQSHT